MRLVSLEHGDVQTMELLRWVIKSAAVLGKSSAITTGNGLVPPPAEYLSSEFELA